MTTTTRRVRGNRYPTYYLGRPRSLYTGRFSTTEAESPSANRAGVEVSTTAA